MLKSTIIKCAASILTVGALLASCTKPVDPTPEKVVPVIKVNSTEVSLELMGGETTINYSIENPLEGKNLVASSDSKWLIVTVTEQSIIASYEANKTKEVREAKITLYYPEAEQVVITAKQEVAPVPFVIEVSNIGLNSADLKVIPLDMEMEYICFGYDKEDFDTKTEEELIKEDFDYIQEIIDSSISWGIPEDDIWDDYVHTGILEGFFSNMQPESEQVIYVYGIDRKQKKAITDMVVAEYKTLALPPKEMIQMGFDFEITFPEAGKANIKTVATPDNQSFYVGIFEKSEIEGIEKEDLAEVVWEDLVTDAKEDYGPSWFAILSDYWKYLWPIGVDDGPWPVESNTTYIALAFGVDLNYGVISNVESQEFTTPKFASETKANSAIKSIKIPEAKRLNSGHRHTIKK